MVFCERPESEPCGRCRGCTLTLGLAHPDLHWLVPIPRPKAGDPDKQIEEAAEALAELLAERRRNPLWTAPEGMAIHGVASARLLQRRAAKRPVEGERAVFLVGDAERLIPQEGNPEGANTLLKLLEEPPRGSLLILTARELGSVLPTIRSRAVPVRLGPVPDEEIRQFLRTHTDLKGDALEERILLADGSIGRALAAGIGEGGSKASAAAVALLEAVRRGPVEAYGAALKQGPWQARGEFTDMLDALAVLLEEAARNASGAGERRRLPAALRPPLRLAGVVRAVESVQQARQAAQGNVNPQLLLAGLCGELAEAL
jgi:DNA polymerase-3 subunit delta'